MCLGTGHISYCDGDTIAIVQRFPERIRYVHLSRRCVGASTRENPSLAESFPLASLHPVEPHIPLPIGARTAGRLRGCGLGPVRRRPYRS